MQACLRHSTIVCEQHTHRMQPSPCMRSIGKTAGAHWIWHRLAGAILPHNEREGLIELDDVLIVGAEAPDALDEQLHKGHGAQ